MQRKIILATFFGFILFNFITYSFAKGGDSMLSKSYKPILSIRIDNNGCAAIASVNGVPVMPEVPPEIGGAMTIPVNEYLTSGKNTIKVKITPLENAKQVVSMGQKCDVSVSLIVGKMIVSKATEATVTKIHYFSRADNIVDSTLCIADSTKEGKYDSSDSFKSSENGDVVVGPVVMSTIGGKYGEGIELQQNVTLPLPFPKWRWLTSDKIENNDQTKQELITQYQLIWTGLKNKNIRKYRSLFKERTDEYAKAYYESPKNMDICQDLQKAENNSKQELVDFVPKYTILKVFGGDRLAELTSWDGATGVIVYNDKDGVSHESYNLIFRKQSGKWIITR